MLKSFAFSIARKGRNIHAETNIKRYKVRAGKPCAQCGRKFHLNREDRKGVKKTK